MTHPTKAIVGTLLKDFVKVSGGRSDGALYSEKDLEKTLDITEVIDFHQTVEIAGIKVCLFIIQLFFLYMNAHDYATLHNTQLHHLVKVYAYLDAGIFLSIKSWWFRWHMQVTAFRAGHVLGACMFEVEIAGMRLLYTGDYSRVPDRHLSAADTPDNPPHIGQCNNLLFCVGKQREWLFRVYLHTQVAKLDRVCRATLAINASLICKPVFICNHLKFYVICIAVIVESTYGVSKHLPRDQREQRFIEKVRGILVRGGRVLLPVVALGRAQVCNLPHVQHYSTAALMYQPLQ